MIKGFFESLKKMSQFMRRFKFYIIITLCYLNHKIILLPKEKRHLRITLEKISHIANKETAQ